MQALATTATRHAVRVNRFEIVDTKSLSPVEIRSRWENAVAVFVADLQVRKSSRESYKRAVSQFFRWMEATGRSVDTMTRADILEYSDYLEEKKTSSKTRSLYLVSVRRFYEWAESYKLYPNIAKDVKVKADRVDEFIKRPLTEDQAREFLVYFYNKRERSSADLRDYAIVLLMLCTGLRTVEITRLQLGDIYQEGGKYLLKVWGKGRDFSDKEKDFQVLNEEFIKVLRDYLNTRENLENSYYMFVSESNNNKGGQLTTRAVSGLCKEGLKAIGLDSKAYTAHSLRHTTATTKLLKGVSIEQIKKSLRHKDTSTTERYVATVERMKRIEDETETMLFSLFLNHLETK